jgi:hypothetical protein
MEPIPCGEPVCEDCTLDAPTNYEEAYKALKREYEYLENDVEFLRRENHVNNEHIQKLQRKLAHAEATLKLTLKTVNLINDNIKLLDEALTLTYMNEEVSHE